MSHQVDHFIICIRNNTCEKEITNIMHEKFILISILEEQLDWLKSPRVVVVAAVSVVFPGVCDFFPCLSCKPVFLKGVC